MEWNGMSVVVGLGSGVMVGVYPSLLSDELGAEQLGRTYPVSLTLAGLINLAGPPALAQVMYLSDPPPPPHVSGKVTHQP
jgi:hypothetical protein